MNNGNISIRLDEGVGCKHYATFRATLCSNRWREPIQGPVLINDIHLPPPLKCAQIGIKDEQCPEYLERPYLKN